jgi:nitroreductase
MDPSRPPSPPGLIDVATIGEDVPLLEGIRTTRAIRRLAPDPVPRELIRKVVEAGTFGPSGGNRQPWSFVAVADRERRAWIAERYRRTFEEYIAPARKLADTFSPARRRNMESAIHLAETLADVPVHLFVAGWTRRGQPQHQALYPAIQNVLLACRAVGLGACITSVHLALGREIDEYLGLPESQPSCALIPIGWPLIPYKMPVRRPVDDCLFWDRFQR